MWTRALLTQFLEPSLGCIMLPAALPWVGSCSGACLHLCRVTASIALLLSRTTQAVWNVRGQGVTGRWNLLFQDGPGQRPVSLVPLPQPGK